MIKWLAIWLVTFGCLRVCAQPAGSAGVQVSGRVEDTTGMALVGATVRLIEGSDTANRVSGRDGSFVFSRVAAKKFRLLVTIQGYLPVNEEWTVPGGRLAFVLPSIQLRVNYNELDPAVVTKVRPVVVNADTVSFSASAFPVPDGSEVEDILRRLPGVEVDMNGNVIVQGKVVSKVIVNGKEFFGGDVLLAIRNLPSDIVDKLQVIDDYGDKARLTGVKTGEVSKVLNIVTQADKRNGEFGQVNVAGGSEAKYETAAFANAFKGDRQWSGTGDILNINPAGSDLVSRIGISYADRWSRHLDGAINLNRSTDAPHSITNSISTSYYPDEVMRQSTSGANTSFMGANSIDGRLNYTADVNSLLRIVFNGSDSRNSLRASDNFTDSEQESGYTKTTTGQSLDLTAKTNRSFNTSLYFQKLVPRSLQRFSVTADAAYGKAYQADSNRSLATVVSNSSTTNSLVDYLTTNSSHSLGLDINVNYFLPVGSNKFLEAGYLAQTAFSVANTITRQPDSSGGLPHVVDSLSQQLRANSLSQNCSVGFSGKLNQLDVSSSLAVGPGYQVTSIDSKGDAIAYHYLSFIPGLNLVWSFSKNQKLIFSFIGRPTFPTPQQVSPYANVVNPLYPIIGNQKLQPEYTENFSLRYQNSILHGMRYFGFGGDLNFVENSHSIVQNIVIPKDGSQVVQISSWANVAATRSLRGAYHFNFPGLFNSRFRINYDGSVAMQSTVTMIDSIANQTKSWTWSQGVHFHFLMPDQIESDLFAKYLQTSTYFPGRNQLPTYFKSATINFNSKYYFLAHWMLECEISQAYTSGQGQLISAGASLNASFRRNILAHNKGSIILSGFNLLNQSAVITQSTTATTVTQTNPMLTGRYYMIRFVLKLQHFR